MNVRSLLFLLSLTLSVRLDAAIHVWTGATSDRFSDASNWRGGSPAGDANAELSFPAGATRLTATNDLAGLTVRSISLSGSGFTIGGQPIALAAGAEVTDATAGPNEIACDLQLANGLTIVTSSFFTSGELRFSGAIRGNGGVAKLGEGIASFTGAQPNTYAGETRVLHGQLRLAKGHGVTAVPADLFIDGTGASGEWGSVSAFSNEQIANAARIHIGAGSSFGTAAIETLGPLELVGGARLQTAAAFSNVSRSIGTIVLGGDLTILPGSNVVQFSGDVALLGTRRIISCANCARTEFARLREAAPGSGLVLRGQQPNIASIRIDNGSYRGATLIEGATATIQNPNTTVRLRDGRFSGSVAALVAESGTVENVTTKGDLQLSAWTTVRATTSGTPQLIAGGALDLGNATLDLVIDSSVSRLFGRTFELVRKTSAGPIKGTFARAGHGALLLNRFVVSYHGGDGNDVTLTEAGRYATSLHVSASSDSVRSGETVQLTARVSKLEGGPALSGQVTVREGATLIGSAAVDGSGNAAITLQPAAGRHDYTVTYEGDGQFAPSQTTRVVNVSAQAPVITSVEPSTFSGGTTVDVVVRGSGFLPGGELYLGGNGLALTSVTPTEVRFTWKVWTFEEDTTWELVYQQPSPGVVRSNAVPIIIQAAPTPKSVLKFEPNAVLGPVVPGGGGAWLSIGRSGASYRRSFAITSDSDRDGITRWEVGPPAPFGLWILADLTDGKISAGNPEGLAPLPSAFPRAMFLRDANGRYSHVVFERAGSWDLMWVRPGVGAWFYSVTDNSRNDLDGAQNGRIVFNTASMAGVGANAVPPPAGVEAGDSFVAMEWQFQEWFGDRVGDHLHESDGAGTLRLASAFTVRAEEKSGVARVTVMRTGGSDGTVTVRYATANETARAGIHYSAVAGTLTFGPGEILKTIEIPLFDDALYSGNTKFTLILGSPAGTTLGGEPLQTIEIVEDESVPRLSAANLTVTEGDDGEREVRFDVTLTGAPRAAVTADWSYRLANDDGSMRTGTLTFLPGGATTQTITIRYTANRIPEADRIIHVSLFNITNAAPQRIDHTVVVTDDDLAAITVLDATVSELRNSVAVTIALTAPSAKEVTVKFATAGGSATADGDFSVTRGTAIFSRFANRFQVVIPITPDAISEGEESFQLVLSEPSGATLAREAATVTILDDDSAALPSLGGVAAYVNEIGGESARVSIRLSFPTTRAVRFRAATVPGSALENSDYQPLNEIVTIAAGETEAIVSVKVLSDETAEGFESLTVALSEADGATIATPAIPVTILDNRAAPADVLGLTITADDVQLAESGATARFTIRLSRAWPAPVTVAYATADGSAVAVADYGAVAGSVTFAPGETAKSIDVAVHADDEYEADETFTLVYGDQAATARVMNDDPAPVRRRSVR